MTATRHPRATAALAFLGLVALAASPSATAQPRRGAGIDMVTQLVLDHRMQDMMSHRMQRWDVRVRVSSAAEGRVELHLTGTLRSHVATLHPGGSATSTEPRTTDVDERWTGRLRREGDILLVRFERTDAYRPALDVEVEWRCERASVDIAGRQVDCFRCATDQARTRPAGAAHPLPAYLQIPLHLAPPAARLAATIAAHGGADHRSTVSSARFTRASR